MQRNFFFVSCLLLLFIVGVGVGFVFLYNQCFAYCVAMYHAVHDVYTIFCLYILLTVCINIFLKYELSPRNCKLQFPGQTHDKCKMLEMLVYN